MHSMLFRIIGLSASAALLAATSAWADNDTIYATESEFVDGQLRTEMVNTTFTASPNLFEARSDNGTGRLVLTGILDRFENQNIASLSLCREKADGCEMILRVPGERFARDKPFSMRVGSTSGAGIGVIIRRGNSKPLAH